MIGQGVSAEYSKLGEMNQGLYLQISHSVFPSLGKRILLSSREREGTLKIGFSRPTSG